MAEQNDLFDISQDINEHLSFKKYKFIDLFAGIGGFHLAFSQIGCKCVFASEIDDNARLTYLRNYEDAKELNSLGLFNKDIKEIMPSDIPDFDILCAGFPCQPFSQAGKKKGFDDVYGGERGNLFFYIADIIQEKSPKAFFLENVRGLINHDNGNTFDVIRKILEQELGYSFYFNVIRACDYGLPQLRPRVFIVGFKDDYIKEFSFPSKKALLYTMSDIFNGQCDKEIGYTLRVGGRGSKIGDRRNWEFYYVNNEVKRISSKEAVKMQGFPEDFEFPVSETQAMKQLGNSVAVNAVKEVGKSIVSYLNKLEQESELMTNNDKGKNKGEWTELLTFIKLLNDKKVYLSDSDLNAKQDYINIRNITTRNLDKEFCIVEDNIVNILDKESGNIISTKEISSFLDDEILFSLKEKIKNSKGSSFKVDEFSVIQNSLGISVVKGGNSNNKSDIVLDFLYKKDIYKDNGFGIKSYLGSKPTLLNASGNTNFIFKVIGVDKTQVELINNIESRNKIKDRIQAIYDNGGELKFLKAEKESMSYNLRMIDTCMPEIVGHILISHYKDRCSNLQNIVTNLVSNHYRQVEAYADDQKMLEEKIKRLLVSILLGFFAGKKWDGEFLAKGSLVVKDTGDILAFHILDLVSLKDYLYKHIKVDTPSSSRHKFGYLVDDGKDIYLKLNLQLRF